MDLARIADVFARDCRLDPDRRVVVGVSGGADSLCLLDLLHRLGYPLVVAHFNHGLRLEAPADARAVQHLAASLGVQFILGEQDVAAYADQESLSIEEAARILRYRFLFAQARRVNAQAVAVGHTADDQTETVLMHLIRGSGLVGLTGMRVRSVLPEWDANIPLVRPLLGIWREEVEAYCAERGLQPSFDRSNLDTAYLRNRLRHELIPTLETYNPRARGALWRLANLLAGELEIVEAAVATAWQQAFVGEGEGFVTLDPGALAAQPEGVQRHLFRRAIGRLRPRLDEIDFAAIERCLTFLACPPAARQIDLAAGVRLFIEDGRLYLAAAEAEVVIPAWVQLAPGAEIELYPGRTLELGSGWQMDCRLVRSAMDLREQAVSSADPFQAWLDADHCRLPLLVRTRRPGDRIAPLGLGGRSQKLSDFLINARLPRRARAGWPLVVSGTEIAWVPGFRLAHPFRLTSASRQALILRVWRE